MSEPETQMEPQDALRQMVEGDGFALFVEQARAEWGNAAQLKKIRQALEGLPPDQHSVVTQSILGTADAVMRLFAWPEEQYQILREKAGQPKESADRFAKHRRVG